MAPHAPWGEVNMLDVADQLAIHQLIALYGHIVDERQFSRVNEIFTDDVRYDMTGFGLGVLVGAKAVADYWSLPDAKHPLSHNATNVVITVDPDDTVRVASKGIGVGYKGRVGPVTYRDIVKKVNGRWLMAERICILRTPQSIPAIT
jgi:hypothetical protein